LSKAVQRNPLRQPRRSTTGGTCRSPARPCGRATYTAAQIDQWVAPIALYPDALLSQILMASTYPANVIQAAVVKRQP
jgi:hypothetical protein